MPSVAQQICAARSEGHTSHSAGMHFLAHTSAGTHCADTRARTLQTHILLAHGYALCRHTLCCVQPGQSGRVRLYS